MSVVFFVFPVSGFVAGLAGFKAVSPLRAFSQHTPLEGCRRLRGEFGVWEVRKSGGL